MEFEASLPPDFCLLRDSSLGRICTEETAECLCADREEVEDYVTPGRDHGTNEE
jgi:hypothetical protein